MELTVQDFQSYNGLVATGESDGSSSTELSPSGSVAIISRWVSGMVDVLCYD